MVLLLSQRDVRPHGPRQAAGPAGVGPGLDGDPFPEEHVMDRRQLVVQRAREFFGDRLDDIVHMVREDRNQLRGWQEPAHLRATVRRTIREEGTPTETTAVQVVDYTFPDLTASTPFLQLAQAAGEPDRGQQREAIGRILEGGANALE